LQGSVVSYRFSFNGKENDNEVEGQQDYGMRFYDKRLARFKSVDPLTKDYPWLTPFQYASNMPINSIDMDGLENQTAIDGKVHSGPYDMNVINAGIQSNKSNNQNRAMGSSEPYSLPSRLLNTYAGGIALPAAQASNVRANYARSVSQLEPLKATNPITGSQIRNEYVTAARNSTPQPFKEFASDMKPNLKANPNGRFWVTNPGVNQTMNEIGATSKGVLLFAVANSAYNIVSSEDKIQATAQEVSIWGSAYVGGQIGGEMGAFFGPWGAGIGAVLGSVTGGLSAPSPGNFQPSGNVTPPVIPLDNNRVGN
jgi:RHS repeat-associated protein